MTKTPINNYGSFRQLNFAKTSRRLMTVKDDKYRIIGVRDNFYVVESPTGKMALVDAETRRLIQ